MKLMVWFEPERVTAGTWLAKNHPEWILGGSNGGLLNLGNPAARKWLIDHIDRLITEQGIDLIARISTSIRLSYWQSNDAADRQGIDREPARPGLPGLLGRACGGGIPAC